MLAFILFVTGTALVGTSIAGLRLPKQSKQQRVPSIRCGCPSPDNRLACQYEVGHDGWCHAHNAEWHAQVWNMDEWADTQEAPTLSAADIPAVPTLLAPQPAPLKESVARSSSWKTWWVVAALAAILGWFIADWPGRDLEVITVPACAMEWVDASPGNPLCGDSADRKLTGPELVAKYCVGVDSRRVCNDKTIGVPKEMQQ